MQMLKKSFKGNLSQTSNSKFKVPFLQPKRNIRELIDDPTNKKPYDAFAEGSSQDKYKKRSSSSKTYALTHEKEHDSHNQPTEIQNQFQKKGRKRDFPLTSDDSLPQDELNTPLIKAAYVEFMNKNLSKQNGKKKNSVGTTSPMDLFEDMELSQNNFSEISSEEDTSLTRDENGNLQNSVIRHSQKETSKTKVKRKSKNQKHSKNKMQSSDITTDDELYELSQEILRSQDLFDPDGEVNNEKINSQLQTKSAQKESGVERFSPPSTGSFSQELLNSREVKAAYIEFMNKSLDKENTTKKRNFGLYSSSEDVLEEVKRLSPSNKSKKNSTSRKYAPKQSRNKKLNNSQTKKKPKKNGQEPVKNRDVESSDEFAGLTPEEKMIEIYKKRNVGLYVLCDTCDRARYLPHVVDPLDLPDKWHCYMNPDKKHNKCSDPEEVQEDQEFLIENLYNAGSIVFARMDGFPWWPGMVEDDPDTESYFWLEGKSMKPTHYHITFFDSSDVTRAWIRTNMIKPFMKNLHKREFIIPEKSKFRSRLTAAYKQADDACKLPLLERLMKYGFLKRYKKRAADKKSQTEKPNKKKHIVSPSDEDESGILADLDLSELSFS